MNKMWYRAPIPLLNHPFKITCIRLAALLHLHQLSLIFAVYYFLSILEISQLSDHLVLCPGCFYCDISEVKKANIVDLPSICDSLILKCLVLYILKKNHNSQLQRQGWSWTDVQTALEHWRHGETLGSCTEHKFNFPKLLKV